MWWWGPGDWTWLGGLLMTLFWVGVIVVAVLLLRRELPNLRWPHERSPALELLEERYARGEISREEFLERRAVLLRMTEAPMPPPNASAPPMVPSQPAPPATAPEATTAPPPPPPATPGSAHDQATIPLEREPEDRP